jgi:predicted lipid-binding transport protein (Tim44 family)
VTVLVDAIAFARPGGGSSYSGGGSSGGGYSGGGGGGGDGGGAELVFLLVRLCFVYPQVGIPLLIIAIAFFVLKNRSRGEPWVSGVPASSASYAAYTPAPAVRAPSVRSRLEELRRSDPSFSVILFEDFIYSLYAEVQHARGGGRIARLSAYLAPRAENALAAGPRLDEVSNVVIGAMRYFDVEWQGNNRVSVVVEFDANYTERGQGGEQSYYVAESWTLTRRRDAPSRPPERARVLACPSCGAPLDAVIQGTCSHCKLPVATGDLDWLVADIRIKERQARGPMLTGDVEERGTDDPTVTDPAAVTHMRAILARDPQFGWEPFKSRIALVFREFQVAWALRDLARMRPFFSDNLFEQQRYWVEAYVRAHLRNVTENARITNIELARVTSDRFLDAVTVRVYATGLDYTLDDGGRVVSGSRHKERSYTEYWTLIRGTSRAGPTRTTPDCPNCGAPLKVNMAGHCEYCRVKVTTGAFDWVLSRIEQDEVYQG